MMSGSGRNLRFSPWPILLVLIATGMAVAVFAVTQSVQQREARVAELNHKLLAEQQTLRVLDAEWAYLTRPQRLESLVAMKLEQEDMPPVPAPIATIAPAAGPAEAPKPETPKIAKTQEKPAPAKKASVKPAKKEKNKQASKPAAAKPKSKTAMKDDVWPIARKAPAPARMASVPHVGVARPILE